MPFDLGKDRLIDIELERPARNTLHALHQHAVDPANQSRGWYTRLTPLRLWDLFWRVCEYVFAREREDKRYGW